MPRGGVVKHGAAGPVRTPEYAAWRGMIERCLNPNDERFKDYGGRGIKICPAWRNDFVSFLMEVGTRPSPKHSIDRIDNDGDYEPGNVKWSTAKEQASNRRRWTHCKRGHAFTPENTMLKKNGRRECRACSNAALRARRAAKKGVR